MLCKQQALVAWVIDTVVLHCGLHAYYSVAVYRAAAYVSSWQSKFAWYATRPAACMSGRISASWT